MNPPLAVWTLLLSLVPPTPILRIALQRVLSPFFRFVRVKRLPGVAENVSWDSHSASSPFDPPTSIPHRHVTSMRNFLHLL